MRFVENEDKRRSFSGSIINSRVLHPPFVRRSDGDSDVDVARKKCRESMVDRVRRQQPGQLKSPVTIGSPPMLTIT